MLYTLLLISLMTTFTRATPRLLIYSATAGYRHTSIPTAINALQNSGKDLRFDATEDKTWFIDDTLSQYDALVFLSTTGEVLDQAGKDAFQRYLNKGGNFIGIHSASDCLNTTEFYGKQLGAYFDYHPAITQAAIEVVNSSHPSTKDLPSRWTLTDEMYNFKSDPRSLGAVVVLSVDESSYTDDGQRRFDQGSPHPIAWYQQRGAGVQDEPGAVAGRSFYTSLGHLEETWQNATFMAHVLGGITWALESNTTRAFNESALVGAGAATKTDSPSSSHTPSHTLSNVPSGSLSQKSARANVYLGFIISIVIAGFAMLL